MLNSEISLFKSFSPLDHNGDKNESISKTCYSDEAVSFLQSSKIWSVSLHLQKS